MVTMCINIVLPPSFQGCDFVSSVPAISFTPWKLKQFGIYSILSIYVLLAFNLFRRSHRKMRKRQKTTQNMKTF
jgi:hypothetical protein